MTEVVSETILLLEIGHHGDMWCRQHGISLIRQTNMCVPGYISKTIRVGRLLFSPDFTKKHTRCVVCTKYITKRGLMIEFHFFGMPIKT